MTVEKLPANKTLPKNKMSALPLFEYAIKRMSFEECVFVSLFEVPYELEIGLSAQLVALLYSQVDPNHHRRTHVCDYECVRALEAILEILKYEWRGKPAFYRSFMTGFYNWARTHLCNKNLISSYIETELLLLD